MSRHIRIVLWVIGCLLMAACASPGGGRVADGAAVQAAPDWPLLLPAQTVYRLEPARSWLRLVVLKAGRAAKFGHDHVIQSTKLDGRLYLGDEQNESLAQIHIPVASLRVDVPAQRDWAGIFDRPASTGTPQSTLSNMLAPAVLDAAAYPWLVVKVTALRKIAGRWFADTALTVKQSTVRRVIPIRVNEAPTTIGVSAEFVLTHEELGLKPFTAFAGALAVSEQIYVFIHFEFSQTR